MSDTEYVYTPYITLKNGKRLYARQVGKTVFRFKASDKKKDQNKKR
ncbi:hypothetical protein [Caldimonas tepidiphila]|nr:hypothetical protein [Caldimonas tepidiphila]